MNDGFTYEFGERTAQLETYEWERIWWEHIDDLSKKRILIIGDSISCGYRDILNKMFKGEVYADGLGTSKAVDNPAYPMLIDYMRAQYQDYDVIQFNNGLHGWHLSDEEYASHYQGLLHYVKESFPEKKLIVALSTPVRKAKDASVFDERNARVIERNRIASEIAKNLEAEILDLYTPLFDKPMLYREDGVHLLDEGYELLAKQCLDKIKETEYKKYGVIFSF